jgi:hypothetical protein
VVVGGPIDQNEDNGKCCYLLQPIHRGCG